jgi:hypothetical protein
MCAGPVPWTGRRLVEETIDRRAQVSRSHVTGGAAEGTCDVGLAPARTLAVPSGTSCGSPGADRSNRLAVPQPTGHHEVVPVQGRAEVVVPTLLVVSLPAGGSGQGQL